MATLATMCCAFRLVAARVFISLTSEKKSCSKNICLPNLFGPSNLSILTFLKDFIVFLFWVIGYSRRLLKNDRDQNNHQIKLVAISIHSASTV